MSFPDELKVEYPTGSRRFRSLTRFSAIATEKQGIFLSRIREFLIERLKDGLYHLSKNMFEIPLQGRGIAIRSGSRTGLIKGGAAVSYPLPKRGHSRGLTTAKWEEMGFWMIPIRIERINK